MDKYVGNVLVCFDNNGFSIMLIQS